MPLPLVSVLKCLLHRVALPLSLLWKHNSTSDKSGKTRTVGSILLLPCRLSVGVSKVTRICVLSEQPSPSVKGLSLALEDQNIILAEALVIRNIHVCRLFKRPVSSDGVEHRLNFSRDLQVILLRRGKRNLALCLEIDSHHSPVVKRLIWTHQLRLLAPLLKSEAKLFEGCLNCAL